MQHDNSDEAKTKILDLIRDIKVTLMATHNADGSMHARPMVAVKPEEPFEGTLWFFTRADSRKADELKADPRVLLSYSEPKDQNYVSIFGRGEVVKDTALAEKFWSEFMRTWFPKGPQDPDLALIRVDAESAEFWDTPSSALVYAYGYVKARLTGESPKPGDVGHVDFNKAS